MYLSLSTPFTAPHIFQTTACIQTVAFLLLVLHHLLYYLLLFFSVSYFFSKNWETIFCYFIWWHVSSFILHLLLSIPLQILPNKYKTQTLSLFCHMLLCTSPSHITFSPFAVLSNKTHNPLPVQNNQSCNFHLRLSMPNSVATAILTVHRGSPNCFSRK